jgi:hypothetical protein
LRGKYQNIKGDKIQNKNTEEITILGEIPRSHKSIEGINKQQK